MSSDDGTDRGSAGRGPAPAGHGPADPDGPLDAAASLALIREQQLRVRDGAEPDGRLLFASWGVAWLVGYLTLFTSARSSTDGAPSTVAFLVFAGSLVAAIVVTIVHIVRRTAGVSGVSATTGAMYGWSWTIGFVAIALINSGLARAGADAEVLALAWNALPCLLVGVLYLAGGALWNDRTVYALGVWIVLVGGVATLVGIPDSYAVMAFAGGGGLLVGSLLEHLARRRGA